MSNFGSFDGAALMEIGNVVSSLLKGGGFEVSAIPSFCLIGNEEVNKGSLFGGGPNSSSRHFCSK